MVQQPIDRNVLPEDVKHFFATLRYMGEPVQCAYEICTNTVHEGDVCMLERDTGYFYCKECGQCRRYERKKAAERAQSSHSEE